jgi:hypothetical protein|tara:strand:- start:94 stop:1272 length:1179 start_codon:yes stop_codon:yes gene_type:complete
MILNLEDCLEHLAGLRESPVKFTIEQTDFTIMNSIARQCFKGMALTDRQSALMHGKLQTYRDQFMNLDWDFDYAVNQLRQPLRSIDRSKYIKFQDNTIVVRFPFNKTDICYIHEFAGTAEGYHHEKGTHIHYFEYNERNVLNLLNRFTKKDFVIDDELLEIYNKIKVINDNPQQYLSGINDNYNLININPKLATTIQKEVGEASAESFTKLYDRRFRYGFNYVTDFGKARNELEHQIASRTDAMYHSKPSTESADSILSALWNLDRFPLLVILDNDLAEEQLYMFANYYRDILDTKEQSVLFRLEEKDSGFNQLVKDRKLNNWVDKDTKVVYISKSKLPKILVKNEWKPSATFSFTSSLDRYLNNYVSFNCDLIVYREETMSLMRRHSKYYG